MGPINEDLSLKIAELKIMSSFKNRDSESDYYYKNWDLWVRGLEHVGRCSNHNEAFHSVINRELNGSFGLPSKLKNLIELCLKHYVYLNKQCGKSIQRKVNTYIDVMINQFIPMHKQIVIKKGAKLV